MHFYLLSYSTSTTDSSKVSVDCFKVLLLIIILMKRSVHEERENSLGFCKPLVSIVLHCSSCIVKFHPFFLTVAA